MGVEKSWVSCYFEVNPEALDEERRLREPISGEIRNLGISEMNLQDLVSDRGDEDIFFGDKDIDS
jgi:hypothetical protein